MSAPKRITAVSELLRLLRREGGTLSSTSVSGPSFPPIAMATHQLDGEFHSEADDTTDLDATTGNHGLLPKLSGDATEFLDGTGVFSVPPGGGALDDLSDVTVPTPSDGDVLTFDTGSGDWINSPPTGGATVLDDLTDVNAPTPSDGEALTWDAGTSKWIPVPAGTPAEILDIPTAETDASLVLAPDGAGGVEFRAETGGGGGTVPPVVKAAAKIYAYTAFR